MRVYIAAPFFNVEQLKIVMDVEKVLFENGIEYFTPRKAGVLKDMNTEEQRKTKKEIYEGNIENMEDCTHMIACVEHKDTGTTFEIGYYAACKKPIILFSERVGTVNVMLAEAAFSICDSKERLMDSLNGEYSFEINSLT
jgi:nucleoside 2-deoxyribosyltransferase